MTVLELKQVTKRFGDFTAVDGFSLEVPRGELYALLGRNGAGKTTTLKCLVGLLRPTSGHVLVGGHDVVGQARQAKRLMGYIPDKPFLYEKAGESWGW